MEDLHSEESNNPTFARRVGRAVLGISAAYAGLKIGQEVVSFDMPFYMEMGVATAMGSAATNKLINRS